MCLVKVLAGAGGKVHMAAACAMQAGKSAISRSAGTSAICCRTAAVQWAGEVEIMKSVNAYGRIVWVSTDGTRRWS